MSKERRYCSLAYSVLASLRIGMSGSGLASFQSVKKSLPKSNSICVTSVSATSEPLFYRNT